MTAEEVAAIVRSVVAETFAVDAAAVHAGMVAKDIAGWDSLQHTVLLIRLQTRLGLRLPARQLVSARSVGDLTTVLAAALGAKE
jgi:acyl carrier protein